MKFSMLARGVLAATFLAGACIAPGTPAAANPANSATLQLAQYDRDRGRAENRRDMRRDWRQRDWRRHRRDSYHVPRGWHRYSHRPYNWRTRGCIVAGPVWVCP